MGKAPEIPDVKDVPESVARILRPLKENLEILKGRRGGNKLEPLGPAATDADRNNKINELIAWLQQ